MKVLLVAFMFAMGTQASAITLEKAELVKAEISGSELKLTECYDISMICGYEVKLDLTDYIVIKAETSDPVDGSQVPLVVPAQSGRGNLKRGALSFAFSGTTARQPDLKNKIITVILAKIK